MPLRNPAFLVIDTIATLSGFKDQSGNSSALVSKAALMTLKPNFRITPESGIRSAIAGGPFRASFELRPRSNIEPLFDQPMPHERATLGISGPTL
jgi:hypothetical protein